PVKLFTATRSRSVSFNLLHAKDQSRIQQKIYCPVDDAIIDRSELVRGFEIEKGRYVTFTDEELKALEARNEHAIEITEFLPLEQVDPIYYEERPAEDVDQAGKEPVKEAELTLAKRLIDELTHEKFEPTKYHDNFRARVLEAAERKVAGQEVTEAPAEARRGQVIDLMAGLKASLEKRGVGSDQKAAAAAPPEEEKAAVGESRRRVRSRSPQPAGRRAAAKK